MYEEFIDEDISSVELMFRNKEGGKQWEVELSEMFWEEISMENVGIMKMKKVPLELWILNVEHFMGLNEVYYFYGGLFKVQT